MYNSTELQRLLRKSFKANIKSVTKKTKRGSKVKLSSFRRTQTNVYKPSM